MAKYFSNIQQANCKRQTKRTTNRNIQFPNKN